MVIDNSRALSKMVTIILAVQIGNMNVHSNNSTSKGKVQEKTKWLEIIYFSSLRMGRGIR